MRELSIPKNANISSKTELPNDSVLAAVLKASASGLMKNIPAATKRSTGSTLTSVTNVTTRAPARTLRTLMAASVAVTTAMMISRPAVVAKTGESEPVAAARTFITAETPRRLVVKFISPARKPT